MIDISKIGLNFKRKPLLIGGAAMEHYGLRKTGSDIDLVVAKSDHKKLAALHPNNIQVIANDTGIIVGKFEIWDTICTFDYPYLGVGAIDRGDVLVASLEKLLFLKALAAKSSKKNQRDLRLIVERVLADAYA